MISKKLLRSSLRKGGATVMAGGFTTMLALMPTHPSNEKHDTLGTKDIIFFCATAVTFLGTALFATSYSKCLDTQDTDTSNNNATHQNSNKFPKSITIFGSNDHKGREGITTPLTSADSTINMDEHHASVQP